MMKSDADDLAAELLDEVADRLDGAARREHVVVDEHALALAERVGVQLERVLAVLERVVRADRLRRQLARPARGARSRSRAAGERGRRG